MSDKPVVRGTAPASHDDPKTGDALVRIGAIVFLIGAVATMATMTPLFIGAEPLPTAFYWLSMLMGAGFLIAAAGLLRSIAAQKRRNRPADPAT